MLKSKSAGSSSPSASPAPSDRVTVVLFKDHHHPRSFEVSLGWVKKMGLWLGVGALATLISMGLALRFGWISRTSRPEALKRLEQENLNLKTSNESLEQRLNDLQEQVKLSSSSEANPSPGASIAVQTPPPEPQNPTIPAANPNQDHPKVQDKEKSPLYSLWDRIWSRFNTADSVTPTAGKPDAPGSVSKTEGAEKSSAGAPRSTAPAPGTPAFVPAASWTFGIPAPDTLKVTLTPAQTAVKGDRLSVKFAIQYISNDGRNQQGRIVLLARSPSGVAAYPEGVLNFMDSGHLIAPERGEFFSVGRYREVATEFVLPAGSATGYREIEVLLFKQDNSILLHQRIDAQTAAPAPPPSTPRAVRPDSERGQSKDTLIPPGEDR